MNFSVLLRSLSFLLIAVAGSSPAKEQQERLRLIHADVLRRQDVDERVIQSLEGNVEFRQGETSIFCDIARQFITENKYALIGHVRIYDVGQTLLADTVVIYEAERKQVASGHVVSIADQDTTFADRITYFDAEDKLISEGHVRIVKPDDMTELTAGVAVYQRNENYGKVWDSPVWIQFDSLGAEVTRIIADTLEMFRKENRTLASGNVKITQPTVMATCGEAEFWRDDEKIVLLYDPHVEQTNQRIAGDTLQLYLEDSRLRKVIVRGEAVAVSDADSLQKGRWENKLTGQLMVFYFSEQKLHKVVIENQATSLYHVIEGEEYKGANEVSGDRIVIEFENGKARKVVVQSDPDVARGKFLPPN